MASLARGRSGVGGKVEGVVCEGLLGRAEDARMRVRRMRVRMNGKIGW